MIIFQVWGEYSVLAGDATAREAVVIDPGNQFTPISQFLLDKDWTLRAILLTHGDLSHAARAWDLAAKFQAPVMAHDSALSHLQRLPAEGEKGGLCGVKSPQIGRFLHDGERISFGSIDVNIRVTDRNGPPFVTYSIGDRRFDGFPCNVKPLSAKPN